MNKSNNKEKDKFKEYSLIASTLILLGGLILLYNAVFDDTIEDETYTKCMTLLEGKTPVASDKMSKREIEEMFNFVH